MRMVLAAAAFITALGFGFNPAAAREAPWCAVVGNGPGNAYWDCQYNSIEECRPNVIAGLRGFCNPNPRFEREYVPARAHRVRAKRHARRH